MIRSPSKRCFKCNVMKPLVYFHQHKMMKDGHLNKCKECACADVRKNRELRIEYYRAVDRARANNPKRIVAREEYKLTVAFAKSKSLADRRWNARNLYKKRAHLRVNRAISAGILFRQACSVCGSITVQAHHPDYSQPLSVVWLCPRHHAEEHKRMRWGA